MSKFACINFTQNNILLSKQGSIKLRFLPVILEPITIAYVKGYNIYITKKRSELTDRFWIKLECELLKRDIAYIKLSENEQYPFQEMILISGEQLTRLLSGCIMDYIFKYHLIAADLKYAKVAIITGYINETIDVIIPLLERVTNLTLFSEVPSIYKGIREDIYNIARLKPKVFYPNQKLISEMDIIFDISGLGTYVNWCNPKSIYIDFTKAIIKQKIKLNTLSPIIWYDFDIVFGSQEIEKPILEAILYEDGFTKRMLRRKINQLNIRIIRAYSSLKVDKK